MFSSIELNTLAGLAHYNYLCSPTLDREYLFRKLSSYSKIMELVEKKAQEIYEDKKPKMDSCGTSLHKVWVMQDMMFGPSIHLELLDEHWSFWEDDDGDGIVSHNHKTSV